MQKLLITILILFGLSVSGFAQSINFSTYADYGLEITNTPSNLNFNDVGPLIANGSTYQLDLYNNASIVEIVGVKYLDVFITVTADDNLTFTDSKGVTHSIDFTLKAAYSNQKGDISSPSGVPLKYIDNITNDSFTIRVPMLERQSLPPGPPPTPPTKATNLDPGSDYSNPLYETLFLYLYGEITIPKDTNAGDYTGNISITISYD